MSVREFKLVNEKGQEYSLMDIENYCLITEPMGLGLAYEREYEKLGDTFVETFSQITQGQINAQANFLKYDNFKKLVDFIIYSEKLKISYKIPFETGIKEYFKDIKLRLIEKSEKQINGIISENITFDCISLWYEEADIVYNITEKENEIRWDFKWDSRFSNYNTRNLSYVNKGHIEAPIEVEIDGNTLNPCIELYVDEKLYQSITIKTLIKDYEKLIYNSKENEFAIEKVNTDGTIEDLFDLDIIDFENDNVMRLPINKSCKIRLKAENKIMNARIRIYAYYIAV